jgi:hypothetical protein
VKRFATAKDSNHGMLLPTPRGIDLVTYYKLPEGTQMLKRRLAGRLPNPVACSYLEVAF